MPETELSPEEKIKKIAAGEFAEHGFSGARMQAIAEEAGVNKALLHYYYRSKEKLYTEILSDCKTKYWDVISQELDNCEGEMELKPMLELIVSLFIKNMAQEPNQCKILFRELIGGHNLDFEDLSAQKAVLSGHLKVMEIFEKKIKSKKIKGIEPIHIFINIMGMCLNTFLCRPYIEGIYGILGQKIEYDETFYRKRIESIVEMAYSGLVLKDESPKKSGKKKV